MARENGKPRKPRMTRAEKEAQPGWIPRPEYKAAQKAETKEKLKALVASAPDDMRLVEFAVQNVMKIKFAHIKPKGNVIVVGGRNGQGKSSLLQAIGFLLCGGELMPTDVIRLGEQTATIQGQIGPFKITRYFDRKDVDEGRNNRAFKTKIRIEGRMGEEYRKPTQLVDEIMEMLSFDPMAFMRMEPKQQFAVLKGMAKFEVDGVPFDIDALDQAQAADYELRREARYNVDAVAARLRPLLTVECPECRGTCQIEVPVLDKEGNEKEGKTKKAPCLSCREMGWIAPEAGEAPADAGELAKRLEEAAAWNARVGTARGEKARLEREAAAKKVEAQELREHANDMLTRASKLDGFAAFISIDETPECDNAASSYLEEASRVVIEAEIDTAEVSAQLAAALEGSAAIERAKWTQALSAEYDAALATWTRLHEGMKARTAEREAVMQAAQMPVDGLAIGVDEVVYQGLPFNQASGAEQIRVSLAIGMAQNPKLKILRFMDGGWDMLDEDSQDLVRAEIDKHKYQLWAEHVGTKGAMTVLMEDGTASGDDVVEEGQ